MRTQSCGAETNETYTLEGYLSEVADGAHSLQQLLLLPRVHVSASGGGVDLDLEGLVQAVGLAHLVVDLPAVHRPAAPEQHTE